MYGLAEGFRVAGRLPADAMSAIVLADPLDRTLGNSFDAMHTLTAPAVRLPVRPRTWPAGVQCLTRKSPTGDEVTALDRLFLLHYHSNTAVHAAQRARSRRLTGQDTTGQ